MVTSGRSSGTIPAAQIDAVMRATRALVGIAATSVAEVGDVVTVPQLRVLVMIATRGPMNLSAVAAGLRVSSPNASRICDRLLRVGLVNRAEDPGDRRNITLTLTADGKALVDRVTRRRRTAIRQVLQNMAAADRNRLVEALENFAIAASEPADHESIALV